jgi:hypothetical protein
MLTAAAPCTFLKRKRGWRPEWVVGSARRTGKGQGGFARSVWNFRRGRAAERAVAPLRAPNRETVRLIVRCRGRARERLERQAVRLGALRKASARQGARFAV